MYMLTKLSLLETRDTVLNKTPFFILKILHIDQSTKNIPNMLLFGINQQGYVAFVRVFITG